MHRALAIPEVVRTILDCFLAKGENDSDLKMTSRQYYHATVTRTFRSNSAECSPNMLIIFRTSVGHPLVGHGRPGSPVQPASGL